MAVRVTGIPQDLHGDHDMPLRARAYRWDPGKMKFWKGVREEGTRKKSGAWGAFAESLCIHAGSASCAASSRPGRWDNWLHLIDENTEALRGPDLRFYLTLSWAPRS